MTAIAWEYLLVLSPDGSVKSKTLDLKNIFKIKYGCLFSDGLVPHVTLSNFLAVNAKEQLILNRLEDVAPFIKPFNVRVDGFDNFPPKTIFLRISSQAEILNLVNKIRASIGEYLSKPFFSRKPHLTIAKRMSSGQFEEAWSEWKDQEYASSFLAKEMVLLKRRLGDNQKYLTVKHFSFNGFEKIERQLSIF